MAAKQKIDKLAGELENIQKEAKTLEDYESIFLKARSKLITNYDGKSLVDLVENSVEVSMEVVKRAIEDAKKKSKPEEECQAKYFLEVQRADRLLKLHYDYFIEYFNCCRFESFASAISDDTKFMVVALHKKPEINSLLRNYDKESYEEATLYAARKLKDKLIAFWDTYIEIENK